LASTEGSGSQDVTSARAATAATRRRKIFVFTGLYRAPLGMTICMAVFSLNEERIMDG